MQQILSELYRGNLYPAEHPIESPAYHEALRIRARLKDQLAYALSPSQRELLDRLWDAESESSYYEDEQLFLTGFRMGMRIAAESLV